MSINENITVAVKETDQISRNVLVWLNSYPDLPVAVINYENLTTNAPSMALSTIQGAYVIKRYILGGYTAEYQFKLVYRIHPGNSMDQRLKADETLNQIGAWAGEQQPNIGEGIRTIKVETTALSSLFARYEDGEEDHQILMKITYEVI